MPLYFLGALLVVYGMAYIVFAFVDPPGWLDRLFPTPTPFSGSAHRVARGVTGAILMVAPLVAAYFMLRR